MPHLDRKIGLDAHPENKNGYVYQNRLFDRSHNKQRRFDVHKARTGQQLLIRLVEVADELQGEKYNMEKIASGSYKAKLLVAGAEALDTLQSGTLQVRNRIKDIAMEVKRRVPYQQLLGA